MITSGLLYHPNSSTLRDFQTVIEETLYLGEKKNWLRESSGWTVLQATKNLLKSNVEWKVEGIKSVVDAALDKEEETEDQV